MALAAETRRFASPELRSIMRRRFAEIGALVLALAGAALLLALGTYDAHDPSMNTATGNAVRNLAGPPGAVIADMLLQGFGAAGVLPGFALLAWAWRIGASRRESGSGGDLLLHVAALLVALPILAAALANIPAIGGNRMAWPTQAGPGGAIGSIVAEYALAAGSDMIGAYGRSFVWAMGAVLAVLLTLLTLGLTAGEWRAAGRAARMTAGQGRRGAGMAVRTFRRTAAAGAWVINRVNGVSGPRDAVPVSVVPPGASPPRSAALSISSPRVSAPRTLGVPAAEPHFTAGIPEMEETDMPPPPASSFVVPSNHAPGFTALVAGKPNAALRKRPPTPPPAPAAQDSLDIDQGWKFPPVSLLARPPNRAAIGAPTEEALQANDRLLESVLADYGVQGRIVNHRPGPVVTLYELEPAAGIRSARVIGLADDVARSLCVTAVRIATVPGRNVIGIEVPNSRRETVYLSELLESQAWTDERGRLALALGKNIGGDPIIADLARMPHLLVAGTTGSGKSVGINAMILSLLFRLSPDQCRLILIDPKMLELSVYEGIPHLMAPVVTEPAKAVTALKWTVREMERRYRAMSLLSVRNIGGYNDRVAEARAKGEIVTRRVQTGFDSETGKPIFEEQPLALDKLPFIVVIIDEMADLMMVAGKEIEITVQRLAQMARAAGIHVVMATQRPSVDVITGTIKANFPTRISFTVISKFDSRTILGEQGAEQLLGQGDMLYMAGGGRIGRVHGPFVSDKEVEDIVAFLREQGEPAYLDEVTEPTDDNEPSAMSGIAGASDGEKSLFDQAVDVVAREGKASTSFIQRHLNIGYNRAAKLIEQMEKEGIVGPANHVGKREVLVRRTNED
jgi:S-DNA-T family DNA segregation ATPase FtsK/SpoIIIE